MLRRDHEEMVRNRSYFGGLDPFGDDNLIFGASKLNLKAVEIPIRDAARKQGETQISRFRYGCLLLRMVFFAFRKLKALRRKSTSARPISCFARARFERTSRHEHPEPPSSTSGDAGSRCARPVATFIAASVRARGREVPGLAGEARA